jgi:hypothetical protein
MGTLIRLHLMIDRAIGLAGIAFTIIFGVLLIVFPSISRKIGWAGLAFGVLLLGTAGGIGFFPDGNAQSPPVVNQGPGSAYSYGQQGGINAGTINVAPQRAQFTPQLGKDLLSHMPVKKPVTLQTVGGTTDQSVGDDVQKFLQDNGYTVNRQSIGVMAPPPDHPFSFSDNQNQYVVIVSLSIH